MSRLEVCRRLEEVGLVPVVRAPSTALAVRAVAALEAGGVALFEITMTVPGAIELIRDLVQRTRGRAVVGAGTVLSVDQARACMDAGAEFIVSPGFALATIQAAHEREVAVIPGALTPTEVISAWQAGADLVKIFPCSAVGGADYVRALRGPLPDVKLLPTGGVSLANAAQYISAGASALGIGSELVDIAALKAGHDHLLTERARALVATIQAARRQLAAARP